VGTYSYEGIYKITDKKIKRPKSKNNYVICAQCGFSNPLVKGKQRRTYKNTKQGRRKDLKDVFFRSAWEANIARYLNLKVKNKEIKRWSYEPKRFEFPIKRGTNSYLPDFLVIHAENDAEWWEVKGYWTSKGKVAVNRFRKYFPNEHLLIIDKKEYKNIEEEVAEKIPKWEF